MARNNFHKISTLTARKYVLKNDSETTFYFKLAESLLSLDLL